MIKSGFKSSEFYVALFGLLSVVFQQLQGRCQFDVPFLLTVGGVVVSYILGRTWLKSKQVVPPAVTPTP